MLWRQILRSNFRELSTLADFLQIDPSKLSKNPRFPLNLPRRIANKIAKNNLADPLLLQFVPLAEEERPAPGFVADPVQDATFCHSKKLLQKYEGRALLVATSTCAMNCRFCFRKNFDYQQKSPFDEEIAHIQADSSLQEVILSGGDPLSLSNLDLQHLFDRLGPIEHVKIIRFHSRFPVGIPERIDEEFLQLLQSYPKQIVFILHSNHPRELDDEVLKAIKSMQKLGIPVLLQTVLLRGVNDDCDTMKELLQRCIHNGIMPYYLHQLDRVEGSAHMEVSQERGKELIAELRSCLPGYAIPTYVAEIPGKPNKTVLA